MEDEFQGNTKIAGPGKTVPSLFFHGFGKLKAGAK
jgi:hypothetical protein